eukprot:2326116-Alexandrium_andersonii.AAC.1
MERKEVRRNGQRHVFIPRQCLRTRAQHERAPEPHPHRIDVLREGSDVWVGREGASLVIRGM